MKKTRECTTLTKYAQAIKFRKDPKELWKLVRKDRNVFEEKLTFKSYQIDKESPFREMKSHCCALHVESENLFNILSFPKVK